MYCVNICAGGRAGSESVKVGNRSGSLSLKAGSMSTKSPATSAKYPSNAIVPADAPRTSEGGILVTKWDHFR